MKKKNIVGTIVGWAFAALFLYATGAMLVGGGGFLAALIGLALVTICAPPARSWFSQKTGLKLNEWLLVVVCGLLFVWQINVAGSAAETSAAREEAATQKTSAERIAKARAENLAYFEANKAAVLQDITSKVQAGQAAEALAIANKYALVSKDPDLARAKRIVEFEDARAQLKNEASLPLAKRAALYKTLAEFDPSNRLFALESEDLNAQLEKEQKIERETKQRAAAIEQRKQAIQQQFSSWDGSHRNVEAAVKRSMKNPDSYKHVETRYSDDGKNLVIITTVRGTNSFGAVVPSTFVAQVDYAGNVLSLKTVN